MIEVIPGTTLYSRLGELPLPYEEACAIAGKIATALADLHRQNVIHHDIKPSSIMFRASGRSRADRLRAVASQSAAGSAAGGVPDTLRHRALYGARAPARGARRSAQRSVFAGRAAVFLHHRRAAVRRERNHVRDAAAAVARSLSAAQTKGGLSALAAGSRAALSGDRSGLALPHGIATRLRPRASRPDQADGAGGAAEPRSHLHRVAPPLQRQPDAAERQIRSGRATGLGSDRDDRARRLGGITRIERGAARHRRTDPGDAARRRGSPA